MEESSFWDNSNTAKKILKEKKELEAWTDPYFELLSRFKNLKELLLEAETSKDILEIFRQEEATISEG